MDHANALIMEYTGGNINTSTISSAFTHAAKAGSIDKGESLMHNKEQHERLAYYRRITDVIKTYDDVLLFGSTSAKVELYNILKKDNRFEKIRIELKNTDKMSSNQQHAFVIAHFSNN